MLIASIAMSQTRQLSGSVRDASNNPVIGATVKVVGKNNVTTTNGEGGFSFTVPVGKITLDISSVGFNAQKIVVSEGSTTVNVTLEANTTQLSEVVVTALGITKEQRKLGYAVTTVGGDQLNKARESNVALSLGGKVAGLNVHGSNGGPGSTARILLRGMPSMNSGGAPLFVINGVPMDNSQRGASGEWGGSDNGDGISNINPDDIESMTVLKGQSASALYGARASNGVILITTKTGKKGDFSVDYNMNYAADQAIDYTNFQYVYGQGVGGKKPTTASEALQSGRFSWGEKLDGSQVIQFDGKNYPYSAVKNNIANFYRTGSTLTNTASVTKGGENGSFRLSLSNLGNQSIVRNSGLRRNTINLNIDQNITDKLKVSAMANYVDEKSTNRPFLSDGPMNPNNGMFLATNIDENILKPGYDPITGVETRFSDDEYVTNPWFVVNQFVNNIYRKRLISSVSAKYNFTKSIYAMTRVGYDQINDRVFHVTPWGTAYSQGFKGGLDEQSQTQSYELNIDGIVGGSFKITEDIGLDATIGANLRKNNYEKIQVGGGPFVLPYLYAPGNVVNFNRGYGYTAKEVHSAYYALDFAYKNFLTLSTTGRYEAYSTLPSDNRTIFVPSVSAGFVFSNLLNMNNLNFGKLRLAYAQTSGEPNDPYQTSVYYSPGNALYGTPTGNFNSGLPNLFLKPFTLTEYEIGAELKFLNNRLGLDVSYYDRKTRNEIMGASYTPSSGYTSGVVATGSTQNKGLELLVTGTPVKSKNFGWNISVNFTSVNNKILHTDQNNNPLGLGVNRGTLGNAQTFFIPGMSGPQIKAYDYKYDSKGEIVVDASGYPVKGDFKTYGSVLPKIYGGINNEFTFKNLTVSFLIDYNYGNKILSATAYYSILRGLNQSTLQGRDGIKVGVLEDGTANTKTADAQGFYRATAQQITSTSILSGDYIKFRQFTIGYNLNDKVFKNVPLIGSMQLSLVGRNLFIIMKHSDNIDPESNFRADVRYAGIEGTSLPSTRSIGINANIKFKK